MKRAILLGLLLSACGYGPPPSFTYPEPEALDAHGLPPTFTTCARGRAERFPEIYDVYYACEDRIISWVSVVNRMTQQEKAVLFDKLQKRGLDYTHEIVVARHGSRAKV